MSVGSVATILRKVFDRLWGRWHLSRWENINLISTLNEENEDSSAVYPVHFRFQRFFSFSEIISEYIFWNQSVSITFYCTMNNRKEKYLLINCWHFYRDGPVKRFLNKTRLTDCLPPFVVCWSEEVTWRPLFQFEKFHLIDIIRLCRLYQHFLLIPPPTTGSIPRRAPRHSLAWPPNLGRNGYLQVRGAGRASLLPHRVRPGLHDGAK